ncbi:MAG TPA: GntR family transcriptional regulator [Solirubrobacteraceae bacterium]
MNASGSGTKADRTAEHLRHRVLSGELRPGERVRISQVARELGFSDIPVREGVKRLEAEGLLRFETHKGAVVASLDRNDIEEVFSIRAELEALAVRRAARTINREQLDELRKLLEAMEEAEREGRVAEYGHLNRAFHFTIYEAQPYKRLLLLIRHYWDSSDWCRRIFVGDASSVRASADEHRGIYEALLNGDGEAAAELLRQQKRRAGAWLIEHANTGQEAPRLGPPRT